MDTPTRQHLAALRERLALRARELEADVQAAASRRAQDAAARDQDAVVDWKEEAETGRREELASETDRLARDALAQVREALRRIDEGAYGDCCDCGEAIPVARLMVQPQAERCAACQALSEQRHGAVA